MAKQLCTGPLRKVGYFRCVYLPSPFVFHSDRKNSFEQKYPFESGSTKICQILLKAGAKADLANERGWSPLFLGVSGNHVDISEILIAAGADLHRRSNTGDTGTEISNVTYFCEHFSLQNV